MGLCPQIQRASVSIMANVAEGFNRQTRKEFSNFKTAAHLHRSTVFGFMAELSLGIYSSTAALY